MKFLKGIGIFFSIILSIVIFVISIVMIVFVSTKNVVSGDNIKKMFKSDNVMELKVGELFDTEEDKTLKQIIIEEVNDIDFDKEVLKKIIESKEFNDLLGSILGDIVDYLIEGGEKPAIDGDDWNNFINYISEENGIGENEREIILKGSDEFKAEFDQMIPERSKVISDKDVSLVFDIYNKIKPIYFVISILLVMGLITLLTWSLYKPLKYSGIPLIISGFLFTIVGLLKNIFESLLYDAVGGAKAVVEFAVSNAFGYLLINSLITLIVGIIFVVLYKIIKDKKNKSIEQTTRVNIEEIKI